LSGKEDTVFDHLGIGATDVQSSRDFFLKALAPLGVAVCMEGDYGVGMGCEGKPSLWLSAHYAKPAPMHIAFTATDRKAVDDFYAAAVAAGGKDNGPPGLRPHYHPDYYAAFVIGPDGHNVEAVCHNPEA
jgi:catechol 2,3-dioxygenase-like lactoylglutathione lyase family enzyme